MRSSKKMYAALGAVMAVGALAVPAMASADTWAVNGTPVTSGSYPITLGPSYLTLVGTIPGVGFPTRVTCSFTGSGGLLPDAAAEVSAFGQTPASTCTSNLQSIISPMCTISASAANDTLPWSMQGDALGQTDQIDGIDLIYTYGPGCGPFAGPVEYSGSLSATTHHDGNGCIDSLMLDPTGTLDGPNGETLAAIGTFALQPGGSGDCITLTT